MMMKSGKYEVSEGSVLSSFFLRVTIGVNAVDLAYVLEGIGLGIGLGRYHDFGMRERILRSWVV